MSYRAEYVKIMNTPRLRSKYAVSCSVIRDKIVLIEDNEIISDGIEVAEKFNAYFSGTADSLGITENKLLLNLLWKMI